MMKINVTLLENEVAALFDLAARERRKPEAQAAWLIRQELTRRGLLNGAEDVAEPAGEVTNEDRR